MLVHLAPVARLKGALMFKFQSRSVVAVMMAFGAGIVIGYAAAYCSFAL